MLWKVEWCHVDTMLITLYEGQWELRSWPYINAQVKTIPQAVT